MTIEELTPRRDPRVKSFVSALLILALLAMGSATVVKADTIQSCSQSSYTVWENPNYYGDGLHVCYAVNLPDLSKTLHLQAGLCNAPFNLNDSWNDCIGSARNYQGSEIHSVCLYVDKNYSTAHGWAILFSTGSLSWSFGDTMNDSISSIRWC